MADILAFPAETGRRVPDLETSRPSAAPAQPGRLAEIVIFPGVRVERHDRPLAERLPPRKRPAEGDGKPRRGRG